MLPKAHRGFATAWWALLTLRAVLPAVFAIVMGMLVAAVTASRLARRPADRRRRRVHRDAGAASRSIAAVSGDLGDRTSAWLYDRLTEASVDPPGIGHLESPELANDMATARDFDLGMQGPPLSLSMDFIADGLVALLSGLACAVVLFGYAWWAPFVLAGAWLRTHWLLRESGVWQDRNTDEVREAQQDADYAYRLAVDPPAAKEVRHVRPGRLGDRSVHRPAAAVA